MKTPIAYLLALFGLPALASAAALSETILNLDNTQVEDFDGPNDAIVSVGGRKLVKIGETKTFEPREFHLADEPVC